jgi:hypothetical protein
MQLSYIERPEDPCALIEGAHLGDATFYGTWLLAAAKAEALWKEIRDDEEFFGLSWDLVPDLGAGAIYIVSSIKDNCCIISLHPTMSEWPMMLEFVMMAELGLLTLTGDRYQMTIPAQEPNIYGVRAAALKLVNTGDDNSTAYPEHFIFGMRRFEAKRWQRRLSAMNEDHRRADRIVLLGIDAISPVDLGKPA